MARPGVNINRNGCQSSSLLDFAPGAGYLLTFADQETLADPTLVGPVIPEAHGLQSVGFRR